MSIAEAISSAQQKVANAYTAVNAKGGTLPATQDLSNLPTAINSVPTGDEITATNTTGSAVSADDRVWVNGEDVYTQNFTAVGSPTIDSVNKMVTMTSGNQYIYKQESFTPTKIEFVIKYKISSLTIKNSNILLFSTTNNALDASYKGCAISFNSWTGLGYYPALYFNSTQLDNSLNSYKNISVDTWVWLKGVFYNGTMTLYGSFDGSTWDTLATSSYSGTVYCNGYWIKGINNNTFVFDLSETYVKLDGEIIWTPYTKTGTNYSIINDTDITSTSFTGIAQANIANNATGSIKTLLDGNGTYAPTTATKSITTNGTYTASAENAYGLSEVTVDVPTPDVWHNWKTDVTASLNNYSDPRGYNWCDIAYGNNKFIAVGNMDSATSYLIESTDGQTWTAKDVLWSKQWRGIASDGTVFVTVSYGDNTVNYTSVSGTWYSSTMPSSSNWRSVAYGNGKFVAIACADNDISNIYAYSSDGGVTWTSGTLPYSNQGLSRIRWCNDRFIIICSSQNNPSNRYFYSTDGENWSTGYFSTPTTYWKDIAYGDGKYLAVADSSGRYAVSTDGVNWTEGTVVSGTTHFYSIAYCNGYFVACQSNTQDKYYTPASSISWTKLESGYSTRCIAANESFFAIPSYGWGYVSKLQISQSQCYTLTASPTTSTQVYEIPKKTSALTITAVGTGTITLSDSKVYNRNSAGDVESPVLGTKTITSNDTYTAASDYLDGFSSVTVDVPSAPTKKYNLLDRVTDDSNNEIGTVSGFFTDANNVEYAVVCLDAQYRLASGNVLSHPSVPTNLPTYGNQDVYGAKETATYNTQCIRTYCNTYGYTSTATSHCRSKSFTIDGTTYYGQLPNLIELISVFNNRTTINTADTSAGSYSSLVIPNNSTSWSSTHASSTDSGWEIASNGSITTYGTSNTAFVIPVLEIPNT